MTKVIIFTILKTKNTRPIKIESLKISNHVASLVGQYDLLANISLCLRAKFEHGLTPSNARVHALANNTDYSARRLQFCWDSFKHLKRSDTVPSGIDFLLNCILRYRNN